MRQIPEPIDGVEKKSIEDIKSIVLHTIARDIVIRPDYNEVFKQINPTIILSTKDGKQIRAFEHESALVCGVTIKFKK